jgi:hypothetical protein
MAEMFLDLLKRFTNLLRLGRGLSHIRFMSGMPVRVVFFEKATVDSRDIIPRSRRSQP